MMIKKNKDDYEDGDDSEDAGSDNDEDNDDVSQTCQRKGPSTARPESV